MTTQTHFTVGTLTGAITVKKIAPHPVLRGQIVSATTHFADVYVKLLPAPLRMAEIVCAWLARDVGLPFPLPSRVCVRRSRVERLCEWPFRSTAEMECFGTYEIPNARPLKWIANSDYGQVEQLLTGWRDALRVGIFDELIANDDRGNGNLLLDANRTILIIDHSRALRAGGQTPFSDPMVSFENPLLKRFAALPLANRLAQHSAVVSHCSQLASAARRIPYDGLGVTGEVRDDIERFVTERARLLQSLVAARIGMPDLPIHDDSPMRPLAH